jgi:hypothetical protein
MLYYEEAMVASSGSLHSIKKESLWVFKRQEQTSKI